MNKRLIKSGSESAVIGQDLYKNYFPIKTNKLMKICKNIDEAKYLNIIRNIDNYSNYYAINDEIGYILNQTDKFYNYVKDLFYPESLNIFNGPLLCYYIDYAGNKELLETITDIYINHDFSLWKSYKAILNFTKHIMMGLSFLHQNKLCHLDVKPENIMVNTKTSHFKLIDFGFTSKEPFDTYITNIRGTPGYFPQYFESEVITEWLPKIETNDMIIVNNSIPMARNRQLVYKIDSYCFGRALYFLKYIYTTNITYCCFTKSEKNLGIKLDNIIASLIDNNIYTRLTIKECMNKYLL